jgi:hypothetical protein
MLFVIFYVNFQRKIWWVQDHLIPTGSSQLEIYVIKLGKHSGYVVRYCKCEFVLNNSEISSGLTKLFINVLSCLSELQ